MSGGAQAGWRFEAPMAAFTVPSNGAPTLSASFVGRTLMLASGGAMAGATAYVLSISTQCKVFDAISVAD